MVDRGIARDEYCCCNESGEVIGVVTSGSPSPTLCKNIALAYVPPAMTAIGTSVYVQIRTQKCKAVGGYNSVLQTGKENCGATSRGECLTEIYLRQPQPAGR